MAPDPRRSRHPYLIGNARASGIASDAILWECGLVPTVHEPCLYSGVINGPRVIFKRQEDDFAVAAPNEYTANIILDMIDVKLTIPMKRQGFLDMSMELMSSKLGIT